MDYNEIMDRMIRFEGEAQAEAKLHRKDPERGYHAYRLAVVRHAIAFRMHVPGVAVLLTGGFWGRVSGRCPACQSDTPAESPALMGCLLTGRWWCAACGAEGGNAALQKFTRVMDHTLAAEPILCPPSAPDELGTRSLLGGISENFPHGVALYSCTLLKTWPRRWRALKPRFAS